MRELVQLPTPKLGVLAAMHQPPLSLCAYDTLLASKAQSVAGPAAQGLLAHREEEGRLSYV